MIDIGVYQTEDGKHYDCTYEPQTKIAQAVGPLPDDIGARGVAFEVKADSVHMAREKLVAKIGPGRFV